MCKIRSLWLRGHNHAVAACADPVEEITTQRSIGIPGINREGDGKREEEVRFGGGIRVVTIPDSVWAAQQFQRRRWILPYLRRKGHYAETTRDSDQRRNCVGRALSRKVAAPYAVKTAVVRAVLPWWT
uniref:Uncharacterized protein n=1 Tax=Haemonchus contortus TaxID=6289 RepID=A0A7I4YLR2_HAECO